MANGSREVARRMRQITAGQLKTANGLRPAPIVVVAEPIVVEAKPKRKAAPRKAKVAPVVVDTGSTLSV